MTIFWLLISELWAYRAVLRVKWPHLKNGIWWTLSYYLQCGVLVPISTQWWPHWQGRMRPLGWESGERRSEADLWCPGCVCRDTAGIQSHWRKGIFSRLWVWMRSLGRPRTMAETLLLPHIRSGCQGQETEKRGPSHEVGRRRIRTVCQVTRGSAGKKECQILLEKSNTTKWPFMSWY